MLGVSWQYWPEPLCLCHLQINLSDVPATRRPMAFLRFLWSLMSLRSRHGPSLLLVTLSVVSSIYATWCGLTLCHNSRRWWDALAPLWRMDFGLTRSSHIVLQRSVAENINCVSFGLFCSSFLKMNHLGVDSLWYQLIAGNTLHYKKYLCRPTVKPLI